MSPCHVAGAQVSSFQGRATGRRTLRKHPVEYLSYTAIAVFIRITDIIYIQRIIILGFRNNLPSRLLSIQRKLANQSSIRGTVHARNIIGRVFPRPLRWRQAVLAYQPYHARGVCKNPLIGSQIRVMEIVVAYIVVRIQYGLKLVVSETP